MKKNNKVCIVNIVANDYLPNQAVFVEQLLKTNKNVDLFCVSLENTDFRSKLFQTIKLSDISSIANYHELSFKYNVLELSTAVKPYIIRWLMTEYGYEKVLYFDSDILVYKSLAPIITALNDHEVVLTPHIRVPIQDDKLPNDISFIKSGYFNLGFIAFRNNAHTLSFLEWWSEKVARYCYIDFNEHYFVDQRWIDYAPIFLDAYIIKDPGYNVAYFNLQEYIGVHSPSTITFMHFSGFNLSKISVHQTRFTPATVQEYYPLFEDYAKRLKLHRNPSHKPIYKYARFNNGLLISPSMRRFLLDEDILTELATHEINLANPFAVTGPKSYFAYLMTTCASTPVLKAAEYLYKISPEARAKFPGIRFDYWNHSLENFSNWFVQEGVKECGFPPEYGTQQARILKNCRPFLLSLSPSLDNMIQAKLRRIAQLIRILKLRDKRMFTMNMYLFFLLRMPDEQVYVAMQEFIGSNSAYKRQLSNSILSSTEYKTRSSAKIISSLYKFLTLIILSF